MWIAILILALIAQCGAVVLALGLVRRDLRCWVWLVPAVALGLMALHRGVELWQGLAHPETVSANWGGHLAALGASLFCAGAVGYATYKSICRPESVRKCSLARERLWEILDSTGVGYFRLNREGRLVEANRALGGMYGRDDWHELKGLTYSEIVGPGQDLDLESVFRRLLQGHEVKGLQLRRARKDGREAIQRVAAVPVDDDGQVVGAEGILLDVTREHRAIRSLQQSETRFRHLYEQIPLGYQSLDADGAILELNEAWHEMTGYARGAVLGRRFVEFISETSAARFEPCLSILRRGESCHALQLDLVCKGGGVRHVMLDAKGRLGEDGIFEQAYCILTDITELNTVQRRLQASLEEKEVLLRELHHRVKNNLQLISSLMSLQAQRTLRPELTDLLSTTQSRIHSIALLHDTLLEPDHLSRPDVPRYFASLVEHLRNTREPADADICFDLNIDEASLDADRAMRCGLIINELASNSLQHAFVDRQRGRVSVAFKRRQDSWLLSVADDGQSRQAGVGDAPARPGLGLELVEALTQQLSGQMEVIRDEGTCVRVEFPAGHNQVKREKE